MGKYSYPDYDGTQNCFGKNTEHFYIDDREKGQTKKNKKLLMDAKIMCSTCPFLDQCRMYALKREKYGVWGGTTPQERDRLRKVLGITLEPYNHGSSLRKLILEGE